MSVFALSDFYAQFGALDLNYPMGFAVRDFFANGGTHAVIVRLYRDFDAGNASASLKAGRVDPLTLIAASPGDWANGLEAQGEHEQNDLFSLRIRIQPGGPQEQFENLTVTDGARRVDRVLA